MTSKFGETLGKGSFATVVMATEAATGKRFAMKIIDKSKCRGQEEHIVKEITILKKLDHQNIIRLYDVFETREKLYLQMELVSGGELFDRIVSRGFYTEKDAQKIVKCLLEALDFLHSQNIVHRDLKPENLLMSSDAEDADIKLADFGLATVASGDDALKTSCGTLTYVAPEILRNQPYGRPVDMWSLGVITYILLSGYPPFWAEDDKGILDLTIHGSYKFFSPEWDAISADAKSFISSLIVVDPAKRMTAAQALKHRWIAEEVEATADIGKVVGENLVKNFNAKRKLKAGMKAIQAARKLISMGTLGRVAKAAPEPEPEVPPQEAEEPPAEATTVGTLSRLEMKEK
ncbi:calcium/calmodulin-dependent protein kinase type 1D-like protein [Hyaloraphidium curvatum]|nr:calcium/calmodulin-dependent protein kinase type 1D-like protein [Hyaloraphidium curvatum]